MYNNANLDNNQEQKDDSCHMQKIIGLHNDKWAGIAILGIHVFPGFAQREVFLNADRSAAADISISSVHHTKRMHTFIIRFSKLVADVNGYLYISENI